VKTTPSQLDKITVLEASYSKYFIHTLNIYFSYLPVSQKYYELIVSIV